MSVEVETRLVEGVKLRRRIAGRKAASGDFNGGRETLAWSERSIGQKELEVTAAVGVASGLVGEAVSPAREPQTGRGGGSGRHLNLSSEENPTQSQYGARRRGRVEQKEQSSIRVSEKLLTSSHRMGAETLHRAYRRFSRNPHLWFRRPYPLPLAPTSRFLLH